MNSASTLHRRLLACVGLLPLLPAGAAAAMRIWDTFAVTTNNHWSNATNWDNPPFTPPSSGDVLIFPEVGGSDLRRQSENDLPGFFRTSRIRILDEYFILGAGLELTGTVETGAVNRTALVLAPLRLDEDVDFMVEPSFNLIVNKVDVRSENMRLINGGKLFLGESTGSLPIKVAGGHLRARQSDNDYDITTLHSVFLESGSVGGKNSFSGNGFTGLATIGQLLTLPSSTGKIAPGSEGNLYDAPAPQADLYCGSISNLSTAVTFEFELAAAACDRIHASGAVALGSAPLDVKLTGSFQPTLGSTYTLINKTGAGAVSGTFALKPEGSFFLLGGRYTMQITYAGGDGNDVVITCTAITPTGVTRTWTGPGSNWDSGANWQGGTAPSQGDDLVFPAGPVNKSPNNNFPPGRFFNSITISSPDYFLQGNSVVLAGGVHASNIPAGGLSKINLGIRLLQDQPVNDTSAGSLLFQEPVVLDSPFGLPKILTANKGEFHDPLTGGGGLIKTGTGVLTLSTVNSFTGPLLVQAGTLRVKRSLGSGNTTTVQTASLNIVPGVALQPVPGNVILTNAGKLTSETGSGEAILGASVAFNTSGNPNVDLPANAFLQLTGALTGSAPLQKAGAGTLRLAGSTPPSYTGTTLVNAGVLDLINTAGAALPGNVQVAGGAELTTHRPAQIPDAATVSVAEGGYYRSFYADTIGGLNLTGGTVMNGDEILSIAGPVTVNNADVPATIAPSGTSSTVHVIGAQTWSVANGNGDDDLVVSTDIGNSGAGSSITRQGTGRAVFTGNNSLPNFTQAAGTTLFEGSSVTAVSVTGGIFGGNGTVTSINAPGGIVSPGGSPGRLSCTATATFAGAATLRTELQDPRPDGTGHDQLEVELAPALGGASLQVLLLPGFSAVPGDQFMIIKNNSVHPVNGTFAGLAQGATLTVSGKGFTISYTGGNGNDVVLTAAFNVKTWTGGGTNANWSTAANWSGGTVPVATDFLVFPQSAARKTNNNDLPAGTLLTALQFTGGGYDVQGNAITLSGGMHCSTTGADNTVRLPVTLSGPQSVTRSGSADLFLTGNWNTGGHDLTLDSGGAGAVIQVNGIVSGAGGVRTRGGSEVQLTAANTYTGVTTIEAGTLTISNNASLGDAAAGTVFAGPGTLLLAAGSALSIAEPLSSGVPNAKVLSIMTAAQSFTGTVTVSAPGSLEFNVNGTGVMTLSGPVSGAGLLRKAGGGSAILAGGGNNDATSLTVSSGILRLAKTGGAAAIGSGGSVSVSPGASLFWDGANQIPDTSSVSILGGTAAVNLNNFSDTVSVLSGSGGTVATGTGTLTLAHGLGFTGAGASTISGKVHLPGANFWSLSDSAGILTVSAVISGAAGAELSKSGAGTLVLSAANTVPALSVDGGTVLVNGLTTTAATVNLGTLGGTGRVTAVTTNTETPHTISPGQSPGRLQSTADAILSANTTLHIELRAPVPATGHDQLRVTGAVELNSATLAVSLLSGYVENNGDHWVIVDNDGTDPVAGTFAGLPEGTVFGAGGQHYSITYSGGDGNDIVLTTVFPWSGVTRVWTGAGADNLWMTAANWNPAGAPEKGDALSFPATAAGKTNINNFPAGLPVFSLSIADGYTITGSSLLLSVGGLEFTPATTASTFGPALTLLGSQTFRKSGSAAAVLSSAVNLNDQVLTLENALTNSSPLTCSGILTGSGALRVTGQGLAELTAANTFSGPVQVLAGQLRITNNDSLANGGATTVEAGATLMAKAAPSALELREPVFLNGGRLAAEGQVHTFNSVLTLTGTGTLGATPEAGWVMPVPITGEGALIVDGGDVTFEAADDNTYTGLTTVRSGILRLSSAGVPVPAGITVGGDGAEALLLLRVPDQIPDDRVVTILTKGTFDLNDQTETVAEAILQAGAITGGGNRSGVLSVVQGLTTLPASDSSVVGADLIFIGDASPEARLNVADGDAVSDLLLQNTFSLDETNRPALIKTGRGSAVCSGGGTANAIRIDDGSCVFDAAFTGLEATLNGGSIAGSGTVGRITAAGPGGSVSPGPGTKNLTAAAPVACNGATTFPVQLNGTAAGTTYDRLTAAGTVSLANARLEVSLGFLPPPGTVFQILNKTSAGAIVGTFTGLAQNAVLTVGNGARLRISYTGGNGNDVTLTMLDAPAADITSFSITPGTGPETGQDIVNITATAATGLTWLLEASSNLINWSTLSTETAGSGDILTFRIPQPGGSLRQYYRIRLP